MLLGDYNDLYSAFSNLVFNAVQYTPAGGRIELRWLAADDHAMLHVRDTGIGIAAHHLLRLTERFYRVDKARSRALGGTGLGLSIVKHLVQSLGGRISVESELGQGTTFSFALPRAKAADAVDPTSDDGL